MCRYVHLSAAERDGTAELFEAYREETLRSA